MSKNKLYHPILCPAKHTHRYVYTHVFTSTHTFTYTNTYTHTQQNYNIQNGDISRFADSLPSEIITTTKNYFKNSSLKYLKIVLKFIHKS